jgi:hypothetical protein
MLLNSISTKTFPCIPRYFSTSNLINTVASPPCNYASIQGYSDVASTVLRSGLFRMMRRSGLLFIEFDWRKSDSLATAFPNVYTAKNSKLDNTAKLNRELNGGLVFELANHQSLLCRRVHKLPDLNLSQLAKSKYNRLLQLDSLTSANPNEIRYLEELLDIPINDWLSSPVELLEKLDGILINPIITSNNADILSRTVQFESNIATSMEKLQSQLQQLNLAKSLKRTLKRAGDSTIAQDIHSIKAKLQTARYYKQHNLAMNHKLQSELKSFEEKRLALAAAGFSDKESLLQCPSELLAYQPEYKNSSIINPSVLYLSKRSLLSHTRIMGYIIYAELHYDIDYTGFNLYCLRNNLSPSYEYISPHTTIGVESQEKAEKLILLAVRNITTGQYISYQSLLQLLQPYKIPLVKNYNPTNQLITPKKLQALLTECSSERLFEGFVVRFIGSGLSFRLLSGRYQTQQESLELLFEPADTTKNIINLYLPDYNQRNFLINANAKRSLLSLKHKLPWFQPHSRAIHKLNNWKSFIRCHLANQLQLVKNIFQEQEEVLAEVISCEQQLADYLTSRHSVLSNLFLSFFNHNRKAEFERLIKNEEGIRSFNSNFAAFLAQKNISASLRLNCFRISSLLIRRKLQWDEQRNHRRADANYSALTDLLQLLANNANPNAATKNSELSKFYEENFNSKLNQAGLRFALPAEIIKTERSSDVMHYLTADIYYVLYETLALMTVGNHRKAKFNRFDCLLRRK